MKNKYIYEKGKMIIMSLCIVLLPILSPYSIFGISLSLFVVFLLIVYFIVKNRGTYLHSTTGLLLFFMFVISIVDSLFTKQNLNTILAIKVCFVFFIYILMFSNVWKEIEDAESYYSVAVFVGKICAILAILQFIFVSLGYTNFYTGRLPLPLEKYSTFASLINPVTGSLRVHSFFEEPSYLAVFELPVFAYLFQREKYGWAIVVAFSCIVSGSVLGIAGIFIITFALFMESSISFKHKLQILLILCVVAIAGLVLLNKFTAIESLFNYYLRRYLDVGRDFTRSDSSVSQRLIGNLPLFENYNIYNKLFGVGANQYPIYFDLATDYSNDFVSMLLNFGYIGFLALIIWLITLVKGSKKLNRIYFVIFLIVLLVDHSWFSDNFFYLLSWVVIGVKSQKIKYLKIG